MQILDGTPLRFGGKTPMSVTQAKFEQKGKFSLFLFFLCCSGGVNIFVVHWLLLLAVRFPFYWDEPELFSVIVLLKARFSVVLAV